MPFLKSALFRDRAPYLPVGDRAHVLTAATNGRRPKQDLGPLKASRKGTEVACGNHKARGPHADGTTQGLSGIPWAEKWPAI
jgi:hypothetical protein